MVVSLLPSAPQPFGATAPVAGGGDVLGGGHRFVVPTVRPVPRPPVPPAPKVW
jgi:hypothetical protein